MAKKSWFKAGNPKYQAALDEFCENETWRNEYKNAPEYMKELLSRRLAERMMGESKAKGM